MRTISKEVENTLAIVDLDTAAKQAVDHEFTASDLDAIVDTEFLDDISSYGFNLHSFVE